MGDASKNLSRHEIACKCNCGFDTLDFETLVVLQKTCDHFAEFLNVDKVTCDITSGCRCLEYNKSVGSTDRSQHPKGRAVDFNIVGVLPMVIYDYLDNKYPNNYGVGHYETFTHLDTRTNGPARWGIR